MAFEIENNLLGNPDYLARFLWANNREAIQENLASYDLNAETYSELLMCLQGMYNEYGVEGVQSILNVNIIPERLTAGEAQAIENVMQTIGDPRIYNQRMGPFGDPQIDPDQFANDYPSSPATEGDSSSGGGAHWTEVTGNILQFGSSILDAFFNSGDSTQAPPSTTQTIPPPKSPNWPLWIGGGLLAIAIIVVIIRLASKKK